MTESGNKFLELARREFLKFVPASVVTAGTFAASMASAANPLSRLTAGDRQSAGLVSIGYWLGSERIASFDTLTHTASSCFVDALNVPVDQATCVEPVDADLIGAESLQNGDQRFAETGAEIRFRKLNLADGQTIGAPPELSIDVHFTPFHGTPFHAWSTSPGSAIGLTVPINRSSGLTLSLDVTENADERGNSIDLRRPAASASAQPNPNMTTVLSRFTLGREARQLKLRRGVYFIAWRGSKAGQLPPWRRYKILATEPQTTDRPDDMIEHASYSRLVQRRTELPANDLMYIMMSVDYAGRTAVLPSAVDLDRPVDTT